MSLDRSRAPRPGPVRPFRFPTIRRGDAGGRDELPVLSARHGELPLVTALMVLDAGGAAEPPERAGIAQLTAAALETGTRRRGLDELAWELEKNGVAFSQGADWDSGFVAVTVPADRLERALELFAEILREPAFPPDQVERLRDEQLADILQRRKEPRALANDAAARFIFRPDTPFARPLIGTTGSVSGLTSEHVREFYESRYRAGSAALVFAGDIEHDRADELAARHFAGWNPGTAEPPGFDVQGAVERTSIFIADKRGSVQSEIRIGDVGVARDHEDYFPLLVMNTILGGAFTSRLNMNLRERHGFTYGASSGFAFRRRPGPFVVQAAVATDVTAPAVQEALREIRLLREQGASDEEVANARDYLRGIIPLQLQTTSQLASRIAELVTFGLPDDYFQHYRQRIAAVTPADVQRVARERLRPDRLAIVIVGDAQQIAQPLRELELGELEVEVQGGA